MFETFEGTVLFPWKVYLWIVVVGSRNLLAIQNKYMLMRGRLKKSQFLRQPLLGSCCFENCLQLHIKPISSNSHQVSWPFREWIFSKQELGIRTVLLHFFSLTLIVPLWQLLETLPCFFFQAELWNAKVKVSFHHFPEARMFFLYFSSPIEI